MNVSEENYWRKIKELVEKDKLENPTDMTLQLDEDLAAFEAEIQYNLNGGINPELSKIQLEDIYRLQGARNRKGVVPFEKLEEQADEGYRQFLRDRGKELIPVTNADGDQVWTISDIA